MQPESSEINFETSDATRLARDPLVSVIVLTYNHEAFLRQAVENIVNQIAPFRLEIVIAEDHSTDDTFEVALLMQRENPAIVRVIHGPTNIGMIPNVLRAIEKCRGKYIAICEGDDFWTDPQKLVRQISEMEKHQEIGVCFTRGTTLSPDGSLRPGWDYGLRTRVVALSEILKREGILVPTASLIWRAERLRAMPPWFRTAPVGDLFMFLRGAAPNGALYLPIDTITYRLGFDGSWTTRLAEQARALKVDYLRRMIDAYGCAAASFGLNPRLFWGFASPARYFLFRHELAAGNYSEAARIFAKIHPSFFVALLRRRIDGKR